MKILRKDAILKCLAFFLTGREHCENFANFANNNKLQTINNYCFDYTTTTRTNPIEKVFSMRRLRC
ncbi:hypothetical protein FLAVO9R_30076 [Flavobacterium sp. 9R]|nr:hypothetical protein FLAVO9R_30076 [Flavobacterium sp. 9R]